MQSVARMHMQPSLVAGSRVTPARPASDARVRTYQARGQVGSQQRQVSAMANPIGKAVENVKKAAEDFNNELESNAKDTAQAREEGYQAPNYTEGEEEEARNTEEYRSTKLKNSSQKYSPKSDPTDLSSGVAGKDV